MFSTCDLCCFRSTNRGNFIEILRWASSTDPVVQSVFEDSSNNATYLSHDIQNELLNIMANQIRHRVSRMVMIVHCISVYSNSENRVSILVE